MDILLHNTLILMDRLTQEQRRKNMQAIKSKGSKIETALGKALFAKGHRYRKNDRTVFGKPDITIKRFNLAIFVDSEFWHGKNWKERKKDFKNNKEFWLTKIESNIRRDKKVNRVLRREGWVVIRFWGKQIENDLNSCILKIQNTIAKQN